MGWTIVNTLDLSGAPQAVEALQAVGALISLAPGRDEVLAALGNADAYLANAIVRIDRQFLDAAPGLLVIGSPSTGTDHMDLEAIDARGIACFDIAREYDLIRGFTATSELAFGLILSLVRQLRPAFEAANQGDWAREKFAGFQLFGKTLGVLGLGRLGGISARIGNGFGMRVIAHDTGDVAAPDVGMVDFATLLREADVLTVHVHLTPGNVGLIGPDALARMKRTSILINTSRGRIVDEAALLVALDNGTIAGAGLDVIDGEWLTDGERARHPLIAHARTHDNLVISPHIGGATVESIFGARDFMARKVASWLSAREAA